MVHHHHRLSPLTLVELPVFLTFGRELSAPSRNMSSSLTSSSSVSAPESSGEQSRSEKRCTWMHRKLQHNSARKHYDQFSILYVYMYMGSNITNFFSQNSYTYILERWKRWYRKTATRSHLIPRAKWANSGIMWSHALPTPTSENRPSISLPRASPRRLTPSYPDYEAFPSR